MSGVLEKLNFVFEDPYEKAKAEKSRGRKVIGITPMFFPEELVHATGALPIVLQESNEPITLGMSHYHHFFCGFTRSIVDVAVKNKLDFLDAFILSDFCFEMRQISNTLRLHQQYPIMHIQWPLEADENRWIDWIVRRLKKCATKLEEITSTKITDGALKKSLSLYNQNRALFREVYELRKEKPGIISAKDMQALVMFRMVSPVEESNKQLGELVPKLEKAESPSGEKVKVFLSGHLCQGVKVDILDIVDDMNGVVAGDDLYTGFRYYCADVKSDGSYFEAFARHYLTLPVFAPTGSCPQHDWPGHIIKATKESKAKGVIILMPKNCEPMMINYPNTKERLETAGIPSIMIETEHETVSLAGIKTRLQAFIEMLSN